MRIQLISIVLLMFLLCGCAQQNANTTGFATLQGEGSELAAHYTFDEGSGTTAQDASTNSNNATLYNGPSWTAGKINAALLFDGSNDYVLTPASSSLNITSAITISAWVNPKSSLGFRMIAGKGMVSGISGQGQYALYDGGNGILQFKVYSASGSSLTSRTSSGAIIPNTWHHVVAIYNGSDTTQLYINGDLVDDDTSTNLGALNSYGDFRVGSSIGNYSSFDGVIDDVRVYSRVLSSSEVQELYSIDSGGTNPNSPDTISPTVSITSPSNGSSATGTITISANATDNTAVAGVQFKLNGANIGSEDTSPPYSISYDTTQTQNGTHTITATARDAAENSATSNTIAITVSNTIDQPTSNECAATSMRCVDDTPGPTQEYSSLQTCADAAQPGDTCLVHAGTYQRVDVGPKTVKNQIIGMSGTASSPIKFLAKPGATSNGFYVRGDYMKIEGFAFTGDFDSPGSFMVTVVGDHVEIANNTFSGRFFNTKMKGMITLGSGGSTTSFGHAHHNIIANWLPASAEGTAIQAIGDNSLIEYNVIKDSEDIDIFQAFGRDHKIRYNVVTNILKGNVGTHIDFIQVFGNNGEFSYNVEITGNFVQTFRGQLGQLVQSCGPGNGPNLCSTMPGANGTVTGILGNVLTHNSVGMDSGRWNMTSERNYTATITSGNAKGKVYLVASNTANTLTLKNIDGSTPNLTLDGIGITDTNFEIRNRNGWYTFKNNIFMNFIDGGGNPDGMSGSMPYMIFEHNTYYSTGSTFSGGSADRGRAANGRVVSNVHASVANIYGPRDENNSFYGNYNYASILPGYGKKNESSCTEEYAFFRFCESVWPGKKGINGGDPNFINVSKPFGDDNIMFTTDDGLKPRSNSILCSKGGDGSDIGAYSCDPSKVFSGQESGSAVNGVCTSTLNGCSSGTFSDSMDTVTEYKWTCVGLFGGSSITCSKPRQFLELDSDGDGVNDLIDRCPKTGVLSRSFVNQFGCAQPIATKFDIKPDFNSTDVNGMQTLEIGITTYGKISYTNQNITLIKTVSGEDERLNLDADLNITNAKITLNQNNLPELNKPATITLYNITTQNPIIQKDGVVCTQCTIILYDKTTGTIVFTVPGF